MFAGNSFNNDLKSILDSFKNLDYSSFEDAYVNVLSTYALTKTKIRRAHNCKFLAKALRKAEMARSRPKNIYLENQNTFFYIRTNLIKTTRLKLVKK